MTRERSTGRGLRQERRALARAARKRQSAALTRGAMAVGALLAAGSASAATFTVSSLADSGPGTLRQAALDANATAGADTIQFQSGLTGTITLTSGDIDLTEAVTITGPGAGLLTVSGNDASRIFDIAATAEIAENFTITNLTVTSGATDGEDGAGIRVSEDNLTLTDVVVSGNDVLNGSGGGISVAGYEGSLSINNSTITGNTSTIVGGGIAFMVYDGGTLSITSSTISGNASEVYGGGIAAAAYYSGTLLITGSTISGNTSGNVGGGLTASLGCEGSVATILNTAIVNNTSGTTVDADGLGGGAAFLGCAEVTIADSVVTGNVADPNDLSPTVGALDIGLGGGLVFYSSNTTISRTTISGNTAYAGGGVYFYYSGATLENVTIANNQAQSPAGDGTGGGIYAYYSTLVMKETTVAGNTAESGGGGIHGDESSDLTLTNSIVANNTGDADIDFIASPTITYSLVETPGTTDMTGTGNLSGQDPQLAPLAGNNSTILAGAPGSQQTPQTFLPACDSPVIDAGDPAFTPPPATDERGFPRVAGAEIDMGAVEVQPSTVSLSVVAQSVNENGGTATVTATRTGFDNAVSVSYTTANGTATAADYTPTAGILTWPQGDTTDRSFTIPITNDAIFEGNEAFSVTLSAPTCDAVLSTPSQTITILDDEATPGLSIDSVAQLEGNSGTSSMIFTVTLAPASAQTVTVNYLTSGGTATPGADYTATSGTLTFAPGVTTQTITVPIVGDTVAEPDETFLVSLSGPTGATLVAADGTGTIQNDDSADADVTVTKTVTGGPFFAGQPLTYTIVVNNAGPADATSVVVTDVIPAGTTFVSATPTQGTCTGTITVTCSLGPIANGGSASIALQVTPQTTGTINNTATVSNSSQPDPDPTNNASTAPATISRPAGTDIPTLGEWARIFMAMVMGLMGWFVIRRR